MSNMSKTPKEEDLVAFCGLFCKDCHGFTQQIPDLARDLRKELRSSRYDLFAHFISTYNFGKDFEKYDECYKVLGAMVKFRCHKGCRGGGGSPFCNIRKCCQKKELTGCWECPEIEECKKLDFLRPVHGEGHLKNLRILKSKGIDGFLEGKSYWYAPETKK